MYARRARRATSLVGDLGPIGRAHWTVGLAAWPEARVAELDFDVVFAGQGVRAQSPCAEVDRHLRRQMEQTLNGYLAALEAMFRNPSDEAARAWWASEGYAPPFHPGVPLATIHRVRLQWLDATDDMLAESRAFLFDHGGYDASSNLLAYTSRTRDAARAKRGLPPLGTHESVEGGGESGRRTAAGDALRPGL
jgi:hypothetical protein